MRRKALRFSEIALELVRFDHVASVIINGKYGIVPVYLIKLTVQT